MALTAWITYFVTTIVLSVTPGPGVFSSLSSGIRHGFRLGLWNGVGMQAANAILVGGVSLGLGAILLASETLFAAVKWMGVAYLLYLGVATWRARPARFEEDASDHARTAGEVFLRGFLVNITNPKGIIFFAATTFSVDIVVMMGYTALAAKALRVMDDPARLGWVNRALGGAFIAAGLALAAFRRAVAAAA